MLTVYCSMRLKIYLMSLIEQKDFILVLIAVVYTYSCPRGSPRINLQVLVLVIKPQVLVLDLGPQSPRKLSRTPHPQIVRYVSREVHTVTATMHEVTVKNGLLGDVSCPRAKFLFSMILKDQLTSPCPCPRTSSPCSCPRAVLVLELYDCT